MVSLSPITGPALGQGTVLQRWVDTHGPVASTSAADHPVGVRHDSGGWRMYTGGSRTRSDGRTELVAIAHLSFGDLGNPNLPNLIGIDAAPLDQDMSAWANGIAVVEATQLYKDIFCVLGSTWDSAAPAQSTAKVAAFGEITAGTFEHLDGTGYSWPYIYDDGFVRQHTPVAIDGGWDDTGSNALIVFAVNSSAYEHGGKSFDADSTVIILDEWGDEVDTITVDYKIRDVRIDEEHIWLLGQHDDGSLSVRGYAHGSHTTPAVNESYSSSGVVYSPRKMRHNSDHSAYYRLQGDLVITGTVAPSTGGDPDIFVQRFGWDGSAWSFETPLVYDNGGIDEPMDVAAVEIPVPASNDYQTLIYIAAFSEATGVDSEFTTLCYRQTDSSSLALHWEARFDAGKIGMALAVSAGYQVIDNETRVIAVVTGAIDNIAGYLDWTTVKYDDTRPSNYPTVPKAERWDIRYPVYVVNDVSTVPAGVTHFNLGGDIHSWVTGFTVDTTSGDDIVTTYYEETAP